MMKLISECNLCLPCLTGPWMETYTTALEKATQHDARKVQGTYVLEWFQHAVKS